MKTIKDIANKYGIQWINGYSVNRTRALEKDITNIVKRSVEEALRNEKLTKTKTK